MLCKAEHFRYSFLHALAYDAHYLSNLFIAVVITVTKLEEYDSLYSKFHDLDFDMGLSQEKQQQLSTVLEYVINRDSSELVRHGIVLQDIRNFVHDVTNKMNEVRGQADLKRALVERVRKILTAESVGTWRRSFDLIAGRTPAPSPSPSPASALPESNNTSGQFHSDAAASALAMESPQEKVPQSAAPSRSTAVPQGLTAEQKKSSEAAWAAHSATSKDQEASAAAVPAQATFAVEAAAVVHAREEAREFEKEPLPTADATEVEVELTAEPEPELAPEAPVEDTVDQSLPVEETGGPSEDVPAPVEETSAPTEEAAQQEAESTYAEVPPAEAAVEVPEAVAEQTVPLEQEAQDASATLEPEPEAETLAAEEHGEAAAPELASVAAAEVEVEVECEPQAEAYVDASAPPCEETEHAESAADVPVDIPVEAEGDAKNGKKSKGLFGKGKLW